MSSRKGFSLLILLTIILAPLALGQADLENLNQTIGEDQDEDKNSKMLDFAGFFLGFIVEVVALFLVIELFVPAEVNLVKASIPPIASLVIDVLFSSIPFFGHLAAVLVYFMMISGQFDVKFKRALIISICVSVIGAIPSLLFLLATI